MENNDNRPKPSPVRRVLALVAALALGGLYIATLLFALMDSPLAGSLLRASLFATFFIPVVLYTAVLLTRVFKKKRDEGKDDKEE